LSGDGVAGSYLHGVGYVLLGLDYRCLSETVCAALGSEIFVNGVICDKSLFFLIISKVPYKLF